MKLDQVITDLSLYCDFYRVLVIEAVTAGEGVEAFSHAFEGDRVTYHFRIGEFVLFQDRKAADEMIRFARPDGFETEILAHQHMIGIAFKCAHVHEVTHFDIGSAVAEVVQALGNCREESRALEDDVGAFAPGCVVEDELLSLLHVADVCNVDGDVRSQFPGQFQSSLGAAHHNELACSADFCANEGDQTDSARSLYDHGVAELNFCTHHPVNANGERFEEDGNFRIEFGFEDYGVRIPQIHIFRESTSEVRFFLGLEKSVSTFVGSRYDGDPVPLLDGSSEEICFDTLSEFVDDTDVFVTQNDLPGDLLVFPVVKICSADSCKFLFQQDGSGFRVGNRVFADFKALADHYSSTGSVGHW